MALDKIATALIKEQIKAREKRILSFPAQDDFVNDPSQFLAIQCTRRAGKTSALARRFKNTMQLYPNSLSRYIALTRDSAKDIMWPILLEMNELHNWDARFIESSLTMLLPNQSRLRLYGSDMKNFIRRLKGAKSPAVAIDEAQDFGPHLESLVDDVLTPTLVDYSESWLSIGGTPGPLPRGMFYEITAKQAASYSVHKWTLYQNPYLPNAQDFVDKLKARKKWDENNPTYLREYQNQWVLDLESLLIRYREADNHFQTLPIYPWIYILGIDIGFKDADALAVLAWSEATPDIYLIEEVVTAGQDITELANQIEILNKKYSFSKMVIDTGGLGLKAAEELRRRKGLPILAADKARKMENVALLNDYLRQSKFKAKKDSRFAQDSFQVQIDHDKSTPDKIAVKKGFHSDILDAVLYAFRESPAWTYQNPKKELKYGSKEWQKNEESELERSAIEYFESQNESSR